MKNPPQYSWIRLPKPSERVLQGLRILQAQTFPYGKRPTYTVDLETLDARFLEALREAWDWISLVHWMAEHGEPDNLEEVAQDLELGDPPPPAPDVGLPPPTPGPGITKAREILKAKWRDPAWRESVLEARRRARERRGGPKPILTRREQAARDREILRLKDEAGWTTREIASKFELSPSRITEIIKKRREFRP